LSVNAFFALLGVNFFSESHIPYFNEKFPSASAGGQKRRTNLLGALALPSMRGLKPLRGGSALSAAVPTVFERR
jgi:hypothetical protein